MMTMPNQHRTITQTHFPNKSPPCSIEPTHVMCDEMALLLGCNILSCVATFFGHSYDRSINALVCQRTAAITSVISGHMKTLHAVDRSEYSFCICIALKIALI